MYTTVNARIPGLEYSEWIARWLTELSLPVFSYAPERGIAASLCARTACYGDGLYLSTSLTGYQISMSETLFDRKIRDIYYRDRDILTTQWHLRGSTGQIVIPVLGPWTLVASVELSNGHRVLEDHGACRDIIAASLQGLATERKIIADLLGISEESVLFSLYEPTVDSIYYGQLSGQTSLETIAAISREKIYQLWRDCVSIWGENTQITLPSYELIDNELAVILAFSMPPFSTADYDRLAAWLDCDRKIIFPVANQDSSDIIAQNIYKFFRKLSMLSTLPNRLYAVQGSAVVGIGTCLDKIVTRVVDPDFIAV